MEQIILFGFLTLFPFGQIIKVGLVNPIDAVVLIGAIYAIFKRLKKPPFFNYLENFLLVISFSWVVSIFYLKDIRVLYGLFYLIRLASYLYFSILVFNFKDKNLLLNSLLSLSLISALLGWIQYFFIPDIRPLIEYGWDDHLYRMVGTFLDPAYLGLILVLGLIISLDKKKKLFSLFLLASIAFTYSRASFLVALIPLVAKKSWLYLSFFLCLIILLPRPAGEGIRLERTASINARLDNYIESINIFKKNTLFGVGFNNICLAKDGDFSNHSCSGSDSSLLLLLATTGVLGLFSFIHLVFGVLRSVQPSTFYIIHSTFVAVFVHSLFSNSLFYPWIMGYLIIILGSKNKS